MRKLAIFSFSFLGAVLAALYLLRGRWLLAAMGAALLSVILAAFLKEKRFAVMLSAFGLAAGFLWTNIYLGNVFAPAKSLDGVTGRASARVLDYPVETDYGGYVDVKLRLTDAPDVKTRVYLFEEGFGELRPGDGIAFTAEFQRADRTEDREYTSFVSRGTFLLATGVQDLERTETAKNRLFYLHRSVAKAVRETVFDIFPDSSAHVVCALLTGEKTALYEDVQLVNDFTRSGIMHILSVSGMHVSILSGALLAVFGKRRGGLIAAAGVLLLFMGVCGFAAPVVRASVMQLFVLTALFLGRENDSLTALGFAALVILLVNPLAAVGVGFQLSFAATLGIVLITPRLNCFFAEKFRLENEKNKKSLKARSKRFVCSSAATSLGALALTTPLTAVYFGSVSLIAPVTNLLALWAVPPLFVTGLLSALAGLVFPPLGKVLAVVPTALVRLLASMARLLAKPFLAAVYVDSLPLVLWLTAVYLCLTLFWLLKLRPRRLIVPACLAVAVLAVILVANALARDNREGYTLTVLDVGQGQCLVFQSGDYLAVVDCGSISGEDAGDIARRFIRSLGRDTVDLLVLTHYHADHVNGVETLFSSLTVGALAGPPPSESDDDGYRDRLLALAEERNTDVFFVSEDMTAELGSLTLSLYAPLGAESENERGVCILAAQDGFETLVTGDITAELELKLLWTHAIPDIECLIVGHHGSKYSTASLLLSAAAPETAVISVGDNNYGHPTPEVLERLQDAGVAVYRTDEDGNVTICSD